MGTITDPCDQIYRSETISLVQLYIPTEIAQSTVAALGQIGEVQFMDMNADTNAFQRAFVDETRRMDELERKVRFLEKEVEKEDLVITPYEEAVPFDQARSQQMIDELEGQINDHYSRLEQMNQYQEGLQKRKLELTELSHVLKECNTFFADARANDIDAQIRAAGEASTNALLDNTTVPPGSSDAIAKDAATTAAAVDGATSETVGNLGGDLEFVAGVIPTAKMPVFERVLWRVLRGNLFMNSSPITEAIKDPTTDEMVEKTVFVVFAHGKEVLGKIRKIAESLGATLYPVDGDTAKRTKDAEDCQVRIDDLDNVLLNTNTTRRAELREVGTKLGTWQAILAREKSLYACMNCFDYDANRKTLIAEAWVPKSDIPKVQAALKEVAERNNATVPPILTEMETTVPPPTYFKTNKFTQGFQAIIDAYGVARYQEVNPGLYTITTFPFLFAMMFGDLGHGILLTLIGIGLCAWEKKLAPFAANEMFGMVYAGRYLVLMMGIWSMYLGVVYNDIFSLGIESLGSRWAWAPVEDDPYDPNKPQHGDQYGYQIGVYPFGVDPAWVRASNKLLFINSYKMKQAILIGVIHMSFGIMLQVPNHLYFKNYLSIWAEWLPQIIFMWAIFGYLCVMIIYKWCQDWYSQGLPPPNLLNTLIYMFLSPGNVQEPEKLYGFGTNVQQTVQLALLIIAIICIPWMLIPKPLILRARHQAKVKAMGGDQSALKQANTVEDFPEAAPVVTTGPNGEVLDPVAAEEAKALAVEDPKKSRRASIVSVDKEALDAGVPGAAAARPAHGGDHGGHGHGEFEFGEVMIHQVIHTIEFCLGCISNTASYLRLWALSLAHAQLSEVLWTMTMGNVFTLTFPLNAIGIWGGFAVWFVLTIAILLIMEGLSAFLHALRLHWVEFNNKFYEGSGRQFTPYAYRNIAEGYDIVVPDNGPNLF